MRVVIPIAVADELIREGAATSTDARADHLPGGLFLDGVLTVWATPATVVKLRVTQAEAAHLLAIKLAAWRPQAYEYSPGYGYEITAHMPTSEYGFELGNPPDVDGLERFLERYFAANWEQDS